MSTNDRPLADCHSPWVRLKTQFRPSSQDTNVETKSTTLKLEITSDKQITSVLEGIDDWTIEWMMNNSARIIKHLWSKEAIRKNYTPVQTTYGDNTRVKTNNISTSAHKRVQCWDEDKKPCHLHKNWLSNEYDVQLAIPHL